jgi:hypothetical protein
VACRLLTITLRPEGAAGMIKVARLMFLAMAVVFGAESVSAASIACLQEWEKVVPTVPVDKYKDPAGYVSGVRIPLISGHFLKFWPLGYRPSVESCYVSILAGKIEKGDYERFRAFVGEHYKAMWAVHLLSPGGDVGEALKIGRLLRKYLFHVVAPFMIEKNVFFAPGHPPSLDSALCKGPSCICASSCALIWFGAIERRGVVGLHRPKITDSQFATLPPDRASKHYRDVLQKISQYLEEMEAPRSLIEAMVSTGSSDIRWVEVRPDES